MNRKILSTIIVLVIAVGGCFLGLFFLIKNKKPVSVPTAQTVAPEASQETKKIETIDTSSWKLYQNKQYGYELKYPAGWEIGTTFNADPYTFSAPDFSIPDCLKNNAGICPDFMVGNIHKIEPGETIARDINFNTDDKIIAEKAMKISGEDASFIEYYQADYGRGEGGKGLVRQEMKVIHGGVLYRIYVHEYASDINKIKTSADWKYEKTFEAMLDSFKFIDTSEISSFSSAGSAEGIVYTNEKFGFSVSLSKGWEKYQVSVQNDKGDNKHTYIYFQMPTADKTWGGSLDKNTGKIIPGVADIFVITVTDLNTWNTDANSKECLENPNPSCPDTESVLAKSGKYVFSASYGNGMLPKDVQKFVEGNSAAKFLSGKFKLL